MAILTPKQKKVLRLRSKGKELSEITGEKAQSAKYALESGQKNLEEAVNTVEWAIKERVIRLHPT